jgi:uncharacterized protein
MQKGSSDSVKVTTIVVVAIVIVALAAIIFIAKPNANDQGTTITVDGIAQLKANPDLVSVYLNIETNATTAKEAKDKNAEIVDTVITEIIKKGIERKDITTDSFNIYPDYSWDNGKQELLGYRATHVLKIQLLASNLDKTGDVIDAGVDAGAMVSYINFELSQSKQNEYKAQALQQATTDARIKAESIATGLGKKLGELVSVTDSGSGYNPWPIYRNDAMVSGSAEAKSAVTSIQPGQQTIDAIVNVVYKIV